MAETLPSPETARLASSVEVFLRTSHSHLSMRVSGNSIEYLPAFRVLDALQAAGRLEIQETPEPDCLLVKIVATNGEPSRAVSNTWHVRKLIPRRARAADHFFQFLWQFFFDNSETIGTPQIQLLESYADYIEDDDFERDDEDEHDVDWRDHIDGENEDEIWEPDDEEPDDVEPEDDDVEEWKKLGL